MDKLCGTIFIYCGNKYDYCYKEAIKCLFEFCDYVVIAAGGDDDTYEEIEKLITGNSNVSLLKITDEEWESQKGKEKLNYFTNIAIQYADKLGFQYSFNLQGDEIVHEDSYDAIRAAIKLGRESYISTRINLWRSPYLQLNVPQNRKPCSTQIIRLAKTNCRSYGDAESIMVNDCSFDFSSSIRIYHMGFVRKREVMKSKIINMQENVFGVNHDEKLDRAEIFTPDFWFDPKTDLVPIDEPLPKLIQDWAKERVYED